MIGVESKKSERKEVFISYNHTNEEHENWVEDLAKRLMDDGVEVILDKWDLKPGHDKYHFMEQMVGSEKINKVLVICDKEYKKKADNREGGVGNQATIISSEIYNNNKNKFIPIVAEKSKRDKDVLPNFMSSLIYIDLASEDSFEKEYEKLLRMLYNNNVVEKPKLGYPPEELLKDGGKKEMNKSENKKSFFSGLFKENSNLKSDEAKTNKNVDNKNERKKDTEKVFESSERLKFVIKNMQYKQRNKEFVVPKIAYNLGLEKSSDLRKYLNSEEEPTFELLEIFAENYSVNSSWLKFNEGQPFGEFFYNGHRLVNYYEKVKELDPEYIYFVTSDSEECVSGIVLGLSKLKYIIFDTTFHLSSHVGNGGKSMILSFYKFVKKIQDNKELYIRGRGLKLEEEKFHKIFSGKLFPGYLDAVYLTENPWWDDFTDIDHEYPIADNYEYWYGKEFIKAQNIVKNK